MSFVIENKLENLNVPIDISSKGDYEIKNRQLQKTCSDINNKELDNKISSNRNCFYENFSEAINLNNMDNNYIDNFSINDENLIFKKKESSNKKIYLNQNEICRKDSSSFKLNFDKVDCETIEIESKNSKCEEYNFNKGYNSNKTSNKNINNSSSSFLKMYIISLTDSYNSLNKKLKRRKNRDKKREIINKKIYKIKQFWRKNLKSCYQIFKFSKIVKKSLITINKTKRRL